MKNVISRVAVLIVVALCAASAFGQSGMLKADIPFDFSIGDKYVPSGTYTVGNLTPEVQVWRNADGKPVELLMTIPMTKLGNGDAKLIFHRYGNEYVLAEIWNGETGRQVRASKHEKQLAKSGSYETIAMLLQPVQQ
jgi:hypothetical protein